MFENLREFFDDYSPNIQKKISFDLSLLFLITLSCVLYVLLTYELPMELFLILIGLDYLVLSIFVIEFVLRFYFSRRKRDFFLDKYTYFDAIAIFPFFLGFNTQYFRIIRIFRFMRFSNLYLNYSRPGYKLSTENIFMFRIIFSLICILFISSGVILSVEEHINPNVNSFDDALYFTLVSVTTVGYGDITPLTHLGKMVTMVVIIFGVVLIPYNIGSLLNHLNDKQHYKHVRCSNCGLDLHEHDSKYCRDCGTKLPEK